MRGESSSTRADERCSEASSIVKASSGVKFAFLEKIRRSDTVLADIWRHHYVPASASPEIRENPRAVAAATTVGPSTANHGPTPTRSSVSKRASATDWSWTIRAATNIQCILIATPSRSPKLETSHFGADEGYSRHAAIFDGRGRLRGRRPWSDVLPLSSPGSHGRRLRGIDHLRVAAALFYAREYVAAAV